MRQHYDCLQVSITTACPGTAAETAAADSQHDIPKVQQQVSEALKEANNRRRILEEREAQRLLQTTDVQENGLTSESAPNELAIARVPDSGLQSAVEPVREDRQADVLEGSAGDIDVECDGVSAAAEEGPLSPKDRTAVTEAVRESSHIAAALPATVEASPGPLKGASVVALTAQLQPAEYYKAADNAISVSRSPDPSDLLVNAKPSAKDNVSGHIARQTQQDAVDARPGVSGLETTFEADRQVSPKDYIAALI